MLKLFLDLPHAVEFPAGVDQGIFVFWLKRHRLVKKRHFGVFDDLRLIRIAVDLVLSVLELLLFFD